MDENKNFETNENLEQEPITEDAADTAAEIAEEAIAAPKKSGSAGIIIAIVAVVVIIVALFAMKILPWNKYNHMGYVNITGKTLNDIAKENNMELKELLEEYNLPEKMPGSTEESAAYYMMPVKRVAQMYGMDFATMKEMLGFGDEITEDTPWGEAEGEVTLDKYVGPDQVESFKAEYGLGEDITGETKWKEVRNIVDKASKKKYEEQMKEAEEAEKAAETEETSETEEIPEAEEIPETEEAPVETEEAPAE